MDKFIPFQSSNFSNSEITVKKNHAYMHSTIFITTATRTGLLELLEKFQNKYARVFIWLS